MNTELQTTNRQEPQARSGDGQDRDRPFVVPPVDVYEDEAGITLLADLPGVSRERLGVRVDGESLVLEATASTAQPEGMQLVYGEAQVPSYRREFTLSRELDASRIEASLKDGVLRLAIPKLEEAKPRRIEVRVD
jgi:HSP20 family protein